MEHFVVINALNLPTDQYFGLKSQLKMFQACQATCGTCISLVLHDYRNDPKFSHR